MLALCAFKQSHPQFLATQTQNAHTHIAQVFITHIKFNTVHTTIFSSFSAFMLSLSGTVGTRR
jgi:hypothetical protein